MMIEKQTLLNPPKNSKQTAEKEISIGEILKIIIRRKIGIITFIVIALLASLLYHYSQIPEYRAVSVVMIKGNMGQNDILTAVLGGPAADNMAVKKDVKLLKSMPISEQMVKELYKTSRKDSLEIFGNRTYHTALEQYVKPFSPLFGWVAQFQKKRIKEDPKVAYWRYAKQLNQRIRVDLDRETNVLDISVSSPFPDEAVYLSNTLSRVYKESDIARNSEKYAQQNDFIADMLQKQQKKVSDADAALIKFMKEHEIFELSGNSQKLLDKLTEADTKYNDVITESRITKNSLDFLQKKLSSSDKEMSERISQNVNTQLSTIMDEMRGVESEYMRLLREKGDDNAEVKAKRRQLDVVKTRYEQLSRSKISGQIGYAGKAKKFSYDVVAEKLQAERKLNDLNFSSIELNRNKQYYMSQLSMLPQKQQDLANFMRDREVVTKTYVFLKQKLDETGIMLGSEVGSVAVIGSAFPPSAPEKPDFNKNILAGLLLGIVFAAVYTFAAEMLDDTVIEESFFNEIGLTLLSIIPEVTQNGKSAFSRQGLSRITRLFYNKSKAFRDKVVTSGNGTTQKPSSAKVIEYPTPMITDSLSSPFAESFRTLRTSLEYTRIDGQIKSILVSGTAMAEGKSTVCLNLGMANALIGKKTLIIDCDLRRASIHKKFNLKRQPGLTDFLFSNHQTIDESSFQPTHMENLFLLSAGKKVPNPNELLASSKMLSLLNELEGQFDMVVLDSPPLFLSDAAQLARSVDGTLLVARLNYSSKAPLKEFAIDPLLRPLTLGVVVIAPRDSGRYGYGKYGYGKYGYGKYGYGKYGYGKYGYGKYGYEDETT